MRVCKSASLEAEHCATESVASNEVTEHMAHVPASGDQRFRCSRLQYASVPPVSIEPPWRGKVILIVPGGDDGGAVRSTLRVLAWRS